MWCAHQIHNRDSTQVLNDWLNVCNHAASAAALQPRWHATFGACYTMSFACTCLVVVCWFLVSITVPPQLVG
jgi:hypothetical protein